VRRSGGPGRRRPAMAGARGSGPLSICTAACRRRTLPAQLRTAIPSRSPSSSPPAGWSAPCWRASSTSSIRP
jgi:hypothetical protein